MDQVVSIVSAPPLPGYFPAPRDISRKAKFCRNIKNWRVPSGWS